MFGISLLASPPHLWASHQNDASLDAGGTSALRVRAIISALGAPGCLLMFAMVFLRPNLFGQVLAPVGLTLAVAAAGTELWRRRAKPVSGPPLRILYLVPICLGLADAWRLVRYFVTEPELIRTAVQNLAITGGTLIAVIVVCRNVHIRLALARAFVLIIFLLSASYVVTALMWAVGGIGSGAYGAFTVPGGLGPQTVYFPATITSSSHSLFGAELPRLCGLGREPGWMAMYCAAAYFMSGLVGMRSKPLKAILFAGMVGSLSTAGFAVFAVVLVYDVFFRARPDATASSSLLRRAAGGAALAVAIWAAIYAPFLGLSEKGARDVSSVYDRQAQTDTGLQALYENPFWGLGSSARLTGINLVSEISNGLAFPVLMALALLLPAVMQGRARQGHAVIFVLFLTILTSQPPWASTWVYVLAVISYACRDLTRIRADQVNTGPMRRTPVSTTSDRGGRG